MSRRLFGIWCFALGAGASSLLTMVATYAVQGSPQWWRILVRGEGYTIYPPLSAVSDSMFGGLTSSPSALLAFNPIVAYATLSGAMFLLAWLLALLLGRREKAVFSGWFWLSWLCVLPLLIHMYGNQRLSALMQRAALQVPAPNTEYLNDIYIAGQPLGEDSAALRQKDSLGLGPADTVNVPF
jgi:hypothetical protein